VKRRSRTELRTAALYPGKRWWYDSDAVVVIEVTKRSVKFAFESGATAHFMEKARVIGARESTLRPFTAKEDRAIRKLQKALYREWYVQTVPF
jgi:hypothetical protein